LEEESRLKKIEDERQNKKDQRSAAGKMKAQLKEMRKKVSIDQ